jgi:hypothetical protein
MLADECQTYVQILRRLPVPAVCKYVWPDQLQYVSSTVYVLSHQLVRCL